MFQQKKVLFQHKRMCTQHGLLFIGLKTRTGLLRFFDKHDLMHVLAPLTVLLNFFPIFLMLLQLVTVTYSRETPTCCIFNIKKLTLPQKNRNFHSYQ